MNSIKPEGKLTVITDYGEGLSKVVDGVSMDTVRKLEAENKELKEQLDELEKGIRLIRQIVANIDEQNFANFDLGLAEEQDEAIGNVYEYTKQLLSRIKDGE